MSARDLRITFFLFILISTIAAGSSQSETLDGLPENAPTSPPISEEELKSHLRDLGNKRKQGDRYGTVRTLTDISSWYSRAGKREKAAQYSDEAFSVAKTLQDHVQAVEAMTTVGWSFQVIGRYQRARECYEKALDIAKLRDPKAQADLLWRMGVLSNWWGKTHDEFNYYSKSFLVSQRIGDVGGMRLTLLLLGHTHRDLGQYSEALEMYEKCLNLHGRPNDPYDMSEDRKWVARVYQKMGMFQKALEFAGIKDDDYEFKADLYEEWGDYEKALEFHNKTISYKKAYGLRYEKNLMSIGNIYLNVGDIASAEHYIKLASPWVDTGLISLGRLALKKSSFREAGNYFEKELDRSRQSQDAERLFAAHTGLGLAHEGQEHYAEAVDHFSKALEITEQIRSRLVEAQRLNFLGVAIFHLKRITPYEGLARVLLKKGADSESLRQAEKTKARNFSESFSRRSSQISSVIPRDVADRDEEINNRLASAAAALQKAYQSGSKERIDDLNKQLKERRTALANHLVMLRENYPLFAATKYPQPMALNHTALQEDEWVLEYEVTEPGICIYLVHGKNIVRALFQPIERKEIEALLRKFRGPLEVIPGKDSISNKLRSFDLAAGKKLSDLLLGEILPDLPGGEAVIIVPDECLSVLPFEMLVLNDGGRVGTDKKLPYVTGAEFFGDRNPLSYHQSITALTLARTLRKQDKNSDRLLVMADPVFQVKDQRAQEAKTTRIAEAGNKFYSDLMATMEDPNGGGLRFSRLPLTGELATNLKEIFKGQSDCYTGFDANKEALLKIIAPKMDQYGNVVLATHGYFNNNNPGLLEPILALTMVPPGTDGFLRMSEVMGLKLNADIVALTACQTGLGRNISGEGTMGMGRAFQYAGAKSVLMTLWNVEQKASVQLVESFFKHRKGGKTKLEALRLARSEIRNDGYDHPFFWAPFILVGETD